MSDIRLGGHSATIVSLRAYAGRTRSQVNTPQGVIRSPRVNALLGELTRTWHFVCDSDLQLADAQASKIAPVENAAVADQICRRMMQSLGQTWSSKIISCESAGVEFSVLFVWREDLIRDPAVAVEDTLWILEPGSPRVRSAEIEREYDYWSLSPRQFIRYLCGRRSVPA